MGVMAKILIVEDDQQMREMLKQYLESEEYEVIDSHDGSEAVKILRETNVDLIITDIIMPEIDGVGLIRNLRREYPNLNIIAISGGSRHIDPQNPLKIVEKLGVTHTFTKPFKLTELLGAVRELV